MERADSRTTQTFATGTQNFVRVLAAAHAAAFLSIWVQAGGLIGPSGILPAGQYLAAVHAEFGNRAFCEIPSLCWVFGTGHFIDVLCGLGVGLSVVLFLGYAQAVCLALLWVFYLSLVGAGQIFFDFQWDALLLESSLVAVFLVPWTLGRTRATFDPPRLARYIAWWLLFRLMFMSGIVKLASGDPTWRHLTALTLHYQTQPLPTPVAWYANQLPGWFQVASCALMFAIEIGAPVFLPAPRRFRHRAAEALIVLQILIALTGNYAFFNLLTIGLCLTCLDDEWWRRWHWGVEAVAADPSVKTAKARLNATAVRWFAAFYVGVTFFETIADLYPNAGSSPIVRVVDTVIGPFQSFNNYGLFRVMTPERPELIIEGSNDGRDWHEYGLPDKPGALSRRPPWVAPHQPRLDWQLWFAALGPPDASPWVGRVCERLLSGDPHVLRLFSHNPFPDAPPRYVRVVRYRYEFTDAAERARTGNWWRRSPIDFFISPVTLPSKQ